jgi:hypothetical protein
MKHSNRDLPGSRKPGRKQRKLGRPLGSYKNVDEDRLVEDIAKGLPVGVASGSQGLSRDTIYNWLDQRPEFAQKLAEAKRVELLRALDALKKGDKLSEHRGWAFWLERVYKDDFGPPQHNTPSFIQNNLQLGSLDEARRILDEAKKLPYRQQPEAPRLATGDAE